MDVYKKLEKYNQMHLLEYINELDENQKNEYLSVLNNIDYELLSNVYENRNVKTLELNLYEPIISDKLSDAEKIEMYNLGLQAIKNKEVACFLVAGGQGTRLGFDNPKGMYDINLPSKKSLFEIYTEKLIYLYNKTNTYIDFYIMTSKDNHDQTVKFFKDNNYFNYDKNHIKFFKQECLPAIDLDGKIILKNKNEINFSPNGNGGCFKSLKQTGHLNEMIDNNVKWVFLFGVDNAICKVCDPIFIGYGIKKKALGCSKVVKKRDPFEKVGVICKKNNHPAIIEYSELTDEMRYLKDENGEYLYSNGNILNHLLHIDFIKQITSIYLPPHLAFKKIETIDKDGNPFHPTKENGYKIEYYLFDTFVYLDDLKALLVDRNEDFSPVKNSTGEDSPLEARQKILNLHKKWLSKYNIHDNYELDFKQVFDYYDLNESNIDEILKNGKKY